MAKIVRTVRFEKEELDKIEKFLKRNPFLDFSTLTRMALNDFIENPRVQIRPLASQKRRRRNELGA